MAERQPRLTEKELRVLREFHKGCKNKEIAQNLGIAPGTVGVQLFNIRLKTNCHSTVELLRWCDANLKP